MTFTQDKFFIVTGASSGIGKSIAFFLNEKGASVIAIARNTDALEECKSSSANPNNFFVEPFDLASNIDGIAPFVKSLKDKYGKLTGLVNCAGVGSVAPLRMVDSNSIKSVFDINYVAPVMLTKAFADKRVNVGKGSSVVSVASISALHGTPGTTVYSGSKGALISSMTAIAKELAPAGIRVNCVSPSLINTKINDENAIAFAEGKYPLGIGQVEDVANMVCYLLSDDAKWVTAQNYVIDCGAF